MIHRIHSAPVLEAERIVRDQVETQEFVFSYGLFSLCDVMNKGVLGA